MVYDSVSEKFGIEKSIEFGIENFWYLKKYRICFVKIWYKNKFGFDFVQILDVLPGEFWFQNFFLNFLDAFGFGIEEEENNKKKYWIRYRKNLVTEKVSDSVSFRFGLFWVKSRF